MNEPCLTANLWEKLKLPTCVRRRGSTLSEGDRATQLHPLASSRSCGRSAKNCSVFRRVVQRLLRPGFARAPGHTGRSPACRFPPAENEAEPELRVELAVANPGNAKFQQLSIPIGFTRTISIGLVSFGRLQVSGSFVSHHRV